MHKLMHASNAEQFYFFFFHGKIKGSCINTGASIMIQSFSYVGKGLEASIGQNCTGFKPEKFPKG